MCIKDHSETEPIIGKRLHEIVDACLEIDLSAAAIASKRARLENDQT